MTRKENYDLVLIPSKSDIHQDHKVIYEEGVRAFSKHCNVLSYDLPWNCRGFEPNYFVELGPYEMKEKWNMIGCYKSQLELKRPYFDRQFIRGSARMRGQQIGAEFAEAFEVVTWIA
jgi:LmbE family N-acetylglucosaminyl deacetylase